MKAVRLIFSLFLVLSLTGCSMLTEYRESEQITLVSSLGFDKADGILLISAETVAQNENDDPLVIASYGKTAEECINNLKNKAGVSLLFSHCAVLAIGESLEKKDISEIFLFLSAFYEFPLSCYTVACRDAHALLNSKGLSGGQTGYAIMRLLKEKNTDSRLFTLLRNNSVKLPLFSAESGNFIYEDALWTKE